MNHPHHRLARLVACVVLAAAGFANRAPAASLVLEYLVVASSGTSQKPDAAYVCYGSTVTSGEKTDDQFITEAIAAVAKTGGTVYLTDGIFYLAAPISLSGATNVKLIGAGPATVLMVNSGANTNALSGSGVSNATLEDFAIAGNGTTGNGLSFPLTTDTGLSVQRLYITGVGGIAANISMSHVRFLDCQISGDGSGIQLNSGAYNDEVIGSTISGMTGSASAGLGCGISCQAAHSRFDSNIISGNTSYGIYLASGSSIGHNSISGNEIYNNGNNEICVGGESDDLIVGNDCYVADPVSGTTYGNAGIEVRDRTDGATGSSDIVIGGNRCYGQASGLLLDNSYSTYAPVDVIAAGNDFTSNSGYSIQRQNVGANCVLQDNLGDAVEACGTAQIGSGTTSVSVPYSLNSGPITAANIKLTPNSNLGSGAIAAAFYVSSVTPTAGGGGSFTIAVSQPAGASGFQFSWQIQLNSEPPTASP